MARRAVRFHFASTVALAAAHLLSPTLAVAQGGVTVKGIAYDSLRGQPLPGAMIAILGTGRSGVTDARGRFGIDSIRPGDYTVLMSHDALDSLGLTGVSTKVTVTDGRGEVRIALPSFTSFWRASCSGRAPRDSSMVYGSVRAPNTGKPVAGAKVELAWLDLEARGKRDIAERMKRFTTTSDSTGTYGFCGVPNGMGFRIRATTDNAASGTVDIVPSPDRVRWRDLSVGPLVATEPGTTGIIVGTVVRSEGAPYADARIVTDETAEVRTDSAGRFVIANMPAGTREIQVVAVGQNPVMRIVDVPVRDTARVYVNMERVATLGSVRISGAAFTRRVAMGLAERQKNGIGFFIDSTTVRKKGTLEGVFADVPGVKVQRTGSARQSEYLITMMGDAITRCAAQVYIDGVKQGGANYDQSTLWSVRPNDVVAVEVYQRVSITPPEFQSPRAECGVVVIWTTRVFR